MNAPENLRTLSTRAGAECTVRWDPVAGAERYELERCVNDEASFTELYIGPGAECTHVLPIEARIVTFRVRAAWDWTYAWSKLDGLNSTWAHLDSLNWRWSKSPFASTEELDVEPNHPPVISGEDGHLGFRYLEFTVSFSITDDPSNTVSVTAALDGTQMLAISSAEFGREYALTIPAEQIAAMEDGSLHTITLIATDGYGAAATRIWTFTAIEDLITDAIYYILRDGVPVAKIRDATAWLDYMAVGTHRYRVRMVDKYDHFVDSGEVEVTIEVDSATLAPAASPADYLELPLRRGSQPQRGASLAVPFSEVYYENRAYPVAVASRRRELSVTSALSTTTKAQYDRLVELIAAGDILVYRDRYDNRVIGTAAELPRDFISRNRGRPIDCVADFTLTVSQRDYSEEVEYD